MQLFINRTQVGVSDLKPHGCQLFVQNFFVELSVTVFFHKFSGHTVMVSDMLLQIVLVHTVKPAWTYAHLEVTDLVNPQNWHFYPVRLNQRDGLH